MLPYGQLLSFLILPRVHKREQITHCAKNNLNIFIELIVNFLCFLKFCLKFQINLTKKTLTFLLHFGFRNFTPLEVPRYDTTTLHKFKVLLFLYCPSFLKTFDFQKLNFWQKSLIHTTYYIKIKITCKTLRFYSRSKICAA